MSLTDKAEFVGVSETCRLFCAECGGGGTVRGLLSVLHSSWHTRWQGLHGMSEDSTLSGGLRSRDGGMAQQMVLLFSPLHWIKHMTGLADTMHLTMSQKISVHTDEEDSRIMRRVRTSGNSPNETHRLRTWASASSPRNRDR